MKKLDARKLTPEVQQHNRYLAIRLFQQGKKRADIAEIVGVHYGVACRWIRAWEHGGEKAIKQGQRGRRPKEQRLLTASQETVLKKLICDKNPDQMKLRQQPVSAPEPSPCEEPPPPPPPPADLTDQQTTLF